MSKEKFYKASIDVSVRKNPENFEKAVSFYLPDEETVAMGDNGVLDENSYADLRGLVDRQPDLMYGVSVLVSEGINKNADAFLRNKLIEAYKTPRNKFVDYEHDVAGEDAVANPLSYTIVGHIYDSLLSNMSNVITDDEEVYRDSDDGKWFNKTSPLRDVPIEILVSWVLYQFEFPELAEQIEVMTDTSPDKFGVSMEVLFNDYKFRIGGDFDSTEDFDFDGNKLEGVREVRKGDPLAEMFQETWNEGKHRTWDGQRVIRILGGDLVFSGMAVTKNRANHRSWNLSLGSKVEEYVKESKDSKGILGLIEAVASKSETFDMDKCEIVDGKPSCGCVENAAAGAIGTLREDIERITSLMGKTHTLLEKAGDIKDIEDYKAEADFDMDFDKPELDEIRMYTNNLENGLIKAQKKIRYLYENTLDNDLSSREILEFVEEIENAVRQYRVGLASIKERKEASKAEAMNEETKTGHDLDPENPKLLKIIEDRNSVDIKHKEKFQINKEPWK